MNAHTYYRLGTGKFNRAFGIFKWKQVFLHNLYYYSKGNKLIEFFTGEELIKEGENKEHTSGYIKFKKYPEVHFNLHSGWDDLYTILSEDIFASEVKPFYPYKEDICRYIYQVLAQQQKIAIAEAKKKNEAESKKKAAAQSNVDWLNSILKK